MGDDIAAWLEGTLRDLHLTTPRQVSRDPRRCWLGTAENIAVLPLLAGVGAAQRFDRCRQIAIRASMPKPCWCLPAWSAAAAGTCWRLPNMPGAAPLLYCRWIFRWRHRESNH